MYATHKWEDDHSYRGSPQGAKIPIPIADSPSLASFIREESLELLSLKASWICIQRAGGAIGNKDSTHKGHAQNLNPSSSREEAVILKDSRSGSLILESLLEKPEATETPLGDTGTGDSHFGELILPQHIDAGKRYFGILTLGC